MDNLTPAFAKILILANTFIKNRSLRIWLNKLTDNLDAAQIEYETFIDVYPDSLDGFSEIIICGGDGSINYVVNKYHTIQIPISIIPLGTGNDLYSALQNAPVSLEKSLDIAIGGTPKFIDAAMCNGHIFTNTFSVGFDATANYDSTVIGHYAPRQLKYALAILKNIFFYKAISYTVDNESNRYTQLTVMNGPRYGNGIRISPNSNLSDKKLELIMLREVSSILNKIKLLLKLKSGKHIYDKLCEIREINNTLIITSENNIKYQIDGECHNGNHFEIKVLPHFYQIKI